MRFHYFKKLLKRMAIDNIAAEEIFDQWIMTNGF